MPVPGRFVASTPASRLRFGRVCGLDYGAHAVPHNSDPAAVHAVPRSTSSPATGGLARGMMIAVGLVFAGLVAFVVARGDGEHDRTRFEAARSLVEFSLTATDGETVTRGDVDGNYLVVNFVHTSCSFECRRVNKRMAEIQRLIADQSDVKLVSLTVDPRTDTPGVLGKYAAEFGAQLDRWMFLTGDKPTLYHLIETSFLSRGAQDSVDPIPGGFVHADRIALVDRHGNVREFFEGMSHTTPAAVTDAIERLRNEERAS